MWWAIGAFAAGICIGWRAGLVLGFKGAAVLVKRGTATADDLKRYADKHGLK